MPTKSRKHDANTSHDETLTADPDPQGEESAAGFAEAFARVDGARYELSDEHARGGLGRILRARDRRLRRPVALKELLHRTPDAEARFANEALITASLEHPGIVPVHDAGRWADGQPFYSMKLVSGRTLKEAIQSRAGYEARVALLPNVIAVADAIAYAHSRGVIHRDLKPSNILVGEHGETVVIDWGLAKPIAAAEAVEANAGRAVSASDLTRAGQVVGTPAYMPPEQARGEVVDARADVYSLGAVLYHVLAGDPPFAGDGSASVLERVIEGPPAPIEERAPRAAPELVAIVHKAMARDARDRYPDAAGLRADLRRFEAGRLVQAHRYSLRERGIRLVRRYRAALAAVALAGLVGATIYVYFATRPGDPRVAACSQASQPERVEAIWSPKVRGAIAAAFAASDAPDGKAVGERLAEDIDWRMETWSTARGEACLQTVRGEQSSEVLDRRNLCFDRQLTRLSVLISSWTQNPSQRDVENARKRLEWVLGNERCNSESILATPTAPTDAKGRALIALIDRAETTWILELDDEAEKLATQAVEQARALGNSGLLGEALFVRADQVEWTGDLEGAIELYEEAAKAAAAAGFDLRVANVFLKLLFIRSERQGRVAEALELAPLAEALVTRAGDPPMLRTILHNNLGVVYQHANQLDESERHLRLSLEAHRKLGNPYRLFDSLNRLGNTLEYAGRSDEAEALFKEGLAVLESVDMRESRLSRYAELGLANIAANRGEFRKAIAEYERQLEYARAGTGTSETTLLANLADVSWMLGQTDTAETYARAVLELEGATGNPVYLAFVEHLLGKIARDRGEDREAIAAANRGLAAADRVSNEPSSQRAALLALRARGHASAGRVADALKDAEAALEQIAAAGSSEWENVEAWFYVADALFRAGRASEATGHAARAFVASARSPVALGRLEDDLGAWIAAHGVRKMEAFDAPELDMHPPKRKTPAER